MDFAQLGSIAATVGAIIAYVFERVPYLREWFAKLEPGQKQLLMNVAMLATAVGMVLYSCRIDGGITAVCVQDGILQTVVNILGLFGIGIGANQGTHRAVKKQLPPPQSS